MSSNNDTLEESIRERLSASLRGGLSFSMADKVESHLEEHDYDAAAFLMGFYERELESRIDEDGFVDVTVGSVF